MVVRTSAFMHCQNKTAKSGVTKVVSLTRDPIATKIVTSRLYGLVCVPKLAMAAERSRQPRG